MPPPTGRLPLTQARALLHTSRFHHTRQCLCGRPQFEHSGARKNGSHPRSRCKRFRRDPSYDLARRAHAALGASHVDVVNAWQAEEYPRPTPRHGGTGVGPSDHGRCKRSIQYRELGIPDGYTRDDVDQDAATIGQIIHDGMLRAFGHQFWWRLIEHPVWIPGLDRYGRVDMFDPVTAILSDIKTLSEYGWDHLLDEGVPDYFWKQTLTYGYALTREGREVETLEIIAVRRSTGEVRYFHHDYDETSALAAIGELRALNANLELARLGVLDLPRLADGGPTRNPLCAKWCEFRSACWQIPQADGTGRSPESRILLGDPIDEEKVAYAAEQLRDWRRLKRDADREVNNHKTLLIGIPPGQYGPWTITLRHNKSPQSNEYYDEIQAAVARGATPEEIGLISIRYTTSDWHDVKPTRAGQTHTPRSAPNTTTPTETP